MPRSSGAPQRVWDPQIAPKQQPRAMDSPEWARSHDSHPEGARNPDRHYSTGVLERMGIYCQPIRAYSLERGRFSLWRGSGLCSRNTWMRCSRVLSKAQDSPRADGVADRDRVSIFEAASELVPSCINRRMFFRGRQMHNGLGPFGPRCLLVIDFDEPDQCPPAVVLAT